MNVLNWLFSELPMFSKIIRIDLCLFRLDDDFDVNILYKHGAAIGSFLNLLLFY